MQRPALYNYQMGIIVNAQGQRFLDEGEDFRDHTYVKFAKVIVEEAGGVASRLGGNSGKFHDLYAVR